MVSRFGMLVMMMRKSSIHDVHHVYQAKSLPTMQQAYPRYNKPKTLVRRVVRE